MRQTGHQLVTHKGCLGKRDLGYGNSVSLKLFFLQLDWTRHLNLRKNQAVRELNTEGTQEDLALAILARTQQSAAT